MYNKEIGQRIRQLRNEKGVTQQELAWKLQITIACLSRYEQGHRMPRMDVVEKIAKLFDVDLNFFLDHSNSKYVQNETPTTKEKAIADILVMLNKATHETVEEVRKYTVVLMFKEKMEKEEV